MRIIDASFFRSLTEVGQRKSVLLPEVCFIGRSNVGKSTLINSLALRKIARTSSTPGATRLINLYNIRWESQGQKKNTVFSDFPGFGYSKVSKIIYENWQVMVEGYMLRNECLKRVLWLFDIRRDFDQLDEMLLEWLRENQLAFSLVLTKADKESRSRSLQKKQAFRRLLGSEDVFLFSSKDGYGRKELLSHVARSLGISTF
ncbi:MAG: putative GTP-binding protein EngB [Syntrophorhabdaceae bacterium PtaU1.Bin034]|jgi:GTP-binding protein|nr:MAG: putative GTP-binding protein EngB [Syntrophorhabdaceae bacterium PtaU1.Bin034]